MTVAVIDGHAEEVEGEPGDGDSGVEPAEPMTADERSEPDITRRKRKKRQ